MGKKEEITDIISEKGIKEIKLGTVLKFDYEGSPVYIKVTKKDTKNMRIWGEHVALGGMDEGMSHYGHELDREKVPMWCLDCDKPVTEFGTKEGELKAWERDPKKMKSLKKGKMQR